MNQSTIKELIPFLILLLLVATTILFYSYFVQYEHNEWPLNNLARFLEDGPQNYSRPLFFTRVPKCGSENLLYVMKALQKRNKFTHNRLVQSKRRLGESQQEDIVKNVMHKVKSRAQPQSFDRHVFFINFSHYHAPFPIYISLIRDPVEKMISRFFYKRGNLMNEYQHLKRKGLVVVSLADWLHWILKTCVLQKKPECYFKNGHEYELTIPYFCGHERECMQLNNRWALSQAMTNLEKYFSVVGLLEDMNTTLNVLEKEVPMYFTGVRKIYHEILKDPRINSNDQRPRDISTDVRQMLESYLHCEYEFYSFASKLLYRKQTQPIP